MERVKICFQGLNFPNLPSELSSAGIRPSWIQKLPDWKKYFLFYPRAIKSFNLRCYDFIISSSSAFAKGAIKGKKALHICYCYTPMRFAWNYNNYVEKENLNIIERRILSLLISAHKKWDLKTRHRPDFVIAISSAIKNQIREAYGREAEVIFSFVDVRKFKPAEGVANYYLIASRSNSYKVLTWPLIL